MAGRLVLIGSLLLVALLAAGPAHATFPGANGRIAFAEAFTEDPGTPTSALSIAAPSTDADVPRRSRQLLFCDPSAPRGCTFNNVFSRSYSPDGRHIMFDGGERIAMIDADGSDLTLLPAVTESDSDPAFSPDGGRIVFTGMGAPGRTDLYVRRVDGRGAARLVVENAARSVWSSRGALAWVRHRKVYVSAADGARERLVTAGIDPDWSPNGRRLVLVRPPGPLWIDGRFHVIRPSGRGLRRVRSPIGAHPVWSPDGRALAFDIPVRGVFVKTLGRRGLRIVAENQASESGSHDAFYPAWRPLPPARRARQERPRPCSRRLASATLVPDPPPQTRRLTRPRWAETTGRRLPGCQSAAAGSGGALDPCGR